MIRSSALVTLITLFASSLGFLVQLLLARRYGVSVDVDAYLFSMSAPSFIAGLLTAVMSYELVPRLVACEIDRTYLKSYITSLVFFLSVLCILLGLAGGAFTLLQLQMLPMNSPLRLYENLPQLLTLGWAISAFQVFLGCLTAILNALRCYVAGALLALIPYIGMIMLLLIFGDVAGIKSLPFGMLMGTILAALCGLYGIRNYLIPLKPKDLLWNELQKLAYSSPNTVFAMTCFSSYAIVDAYWSLRTSPGTLATLGYAQRLIIAFGNLAVAGPSAVLVPRFAEIIRGNNFKAFRISVLKTLMIVGAIAGTLAISMAILSSELIELMFARGSFGPEEVERVAQALRLMLPGMVAMLMSVIALRGLYCLDGAAKIAGVLGILWTLSYFLISMFTHKFGSRGLAFGYSVVWTIHFIILIFVIHRFSNKTKFTNENT